MSIASTAICPPCAHNHARKGCVSGSGPDSWRWHNDPPTVLNTILGTTLFFGNLIDQDPALLTPDWLAAIDVFKIGENLPIRTSGRGCPGAPEDWRMAIIWGRTLVSLTHEVLAREKAAAGSAEGGAGEGRREDVLVP